jgi:transposase-like protein
MVKGGVTLRVAARRHGIARATLYNWLAHGEKGREPYAAFRERLERAQAACEVRLSLNLFEAARDDWRAAAWFLERRFPKRWGSKRTLDVVRKTPADMTDDELEAAIEELGYVRRDRVAEPMQ